MKLLMNDLILNSFPVFFAVATTSGRFGRLRLGIAIAGEHSARILKHLRSVFLVAERSKLG